MSGRRQAERQHFVVNMLLLGPVEVNSDRQGPHAAFWMIWWVSVQGFQESLTEYGMDCPKTAGGGNGVQIHPLARGRSVGIQASVLRQKFCNMRSARRRPL